MSLGERQLSGAEAFANKKIVLSANTLEDVIIGRVYVKSDTNIANLQ